MADNSVDPNDGQEYQVGITSIADSVAFAFHEVAIHKMVTSGDLGTEVLLVPGTFLIRVPRGARLLLPGVPVDKPPEIGQNNDFKKAP